MRPRNIVLVMADSLRWDTVHEGNDHRLPYLAEQAVRFDQARSAGCWTLPATASMFTGLTPHQHGATAQTREVRQDVPTLAQRLQAQGYRTHMVTANVATTHIFGLDRGFEHLDRIWKFVPAEHKKMHEIMVLAGKPRLRRRLFSKDFVAGKLSEDLDAAKVWLQSTVDPLFDRARQVLEKNEAKGNGTFLFLNLMETHFPYHTGDTFETSAEGILGRIREVMGLFHLVNQTWLADGREHIRPDVLRLLRRRQRMAWERIAPVVDAFCQEMREKHDALVVFGSDHGDNFGEQGWLYHFANVTDAGNRVPLYWLPPQGADGQIVQRPVSARDLYGAVLKAAGDPDPELVSVVEQPERSVSMLESYWYNKQGKTLPQYRYNQFAFVADGQRYIHRKDRWYTAPITRDDAPEPTFQPLDAGVDPLQEAVDEAERLEQVRAAFKSFETFSKRVLPA